MSTKQFSLQKLHPKEKSLGQGSLYVNRAKMEWAGAGGIFLSGFENLNNGKFIYQEWFPRDTQ